MTDRNKTPAESSAPALSGVAGSEIDAGQVAPSQIRYLVKYAHAHKTLKVGDVVVMTETPTMENLLLREADMTLHRLQDGSDQYVHLVASPNTQAEP